jgi:hypothetical protein
MYFCTIRKCKKMSEFKKKSFPVIAVPSASPRALFSHFVIYLFKYFFTIQSCHSYRLSNMRNLIIEKTITGAQYVTKPLEIHQIETNISELSTRKLSLINVRYVAKNLQIHQILKNIFYLIQKKRISNVILKIVIENLVMPVI